MPQDRKEYFREYSLKNRKRLADYQREWRAKKKELGLALFDPVKRKAYNAEYYAKNGAKNREKLNEQWRKNYYADHEHRRQIINDYARKKRVGDPRRKAREVLHQKINRGKIVRPKTCSKCGREARVEGHHPDYTKPLEVIWLCRCCHMDAHSSLQARARERLALVSGQSLSAASIRHI